MNEDEVRLFMREPWVATASDGSTQPLDSPSQPHPRAFGTFPRKIGRYAIDGHSFRSRRPSIVPRVAVGRAEPGRSRAIEGR